MPYSDRYAAFIDILGFGAIVKATERDTNRQNELSRSLADIGSRERVDDAVGDDFKFQSFSDSIVMSCNASPVGLLHLLASINELALRLLSSGLLTRGAVAKGKLHHENPVMFGPAFLEAYHIETTIAKYPRVVLSRETYQNFQKQRGAVVANPRILLSEDGPPHLHIFAAFEEAPQDTAVKKLCQGMIQSLLDESIFVPKHYEKLRWLAIYWNSTAARGDPVHRIVFPVAQNLEGLPRAH